MARSPAFLVDPTGQQLLAALQTAVRSEYDEQGHRAPTRLPDPAPLLAEPPAVWLHLLADHRRGTTRTAVLVTRWTDPLGRALWLTECLYEHSYQWSDFPKQSVGAWQKTDQHPLQRIAPPDRYLERERPGTPAQPVVLCRCGAVGSPRDLAWRGAQCGPCFDRAQEGEPAVGPFIPSWSQRVLLQDEHGWIVDRGGTIEGLDPQGQVRWSRPCEGLDPQGGTRGLLLCTRHREVCCVDGHTGSVLNRWVTREPIHNARVLNDHRVLTVHSGHLEWWQVGRTDPERVAMVTGTVLGHLAVDPTGQILLLPTSEGILCYTDWGSRITTLATREKPVGYDTVAFSATHLLALEHGIHRSRLHAWEIPSTDAPPEVHPRQSRPVGLARRLLAPIAFAPLLLLRFPGSFEQIDPETLQSVGSLTFPDRSPPEISPVGADHVLLHGIQENLIVPWRDLFLTEATPNP